MNGLAAPEQRRAATRPPRAPSRARASAPASSREVTLIDLLDRLLQGGIVVHGDITLAAADVDLVELDLRILIAAVDKAAGR